MPHVVIEFTSNLTNRIDPDVLVDAVHAAALATGTAPPDALRTRAIECAHAAVADQHPDNAFVAVTARLGPGRSIDERQQFASALLDAVEACLGDAIDTVMLSAEVIEIDAASRVNRNHLRPHVRARMADESGH
ncbi:MAG: 5-carboxymethyl-2-hydroxymuconate Delta-isomerase [Ilumatobacter sp.]|uniref:5-carboxymethyl-2-hydroxymuconate Delta-isomerase n=1 Tax=Ilumatobacter sp. TaxID=1967498 RepID=UPI00391A3A96